MLKLYQAIMSDHVQEKLEMGRRHLDAYRRNGLGMGPASEGEEMKITSAGDVYYTAAPQQPQPVQQQKSSLLPVLMTAGLTAVGLGPVAGIGNYLINQILTQKQTSEQPLAIPTKVINNTTTEELSVRLLSKDELQP